MNISSQSAYQHLAQYQQPVAIPGKPDLITIPEFEKPELSPENRLKLQDRIAEKIDDVKTGLQEQRDALRELTVGYIGTQSKKTQWEIYMSVTTEADMDSDAPSGIEFYQTLRDIQKQNNVVKAYAAYQENALEA
ncbi:hypothetical protein [Hydrogenimonas sp.]|uniref:hypothetical protein n=1 Tax=Hydrogenimonas sp. TaxID=2231112 RepID=UPI00263833E3|nr:hypothetical protein [Hydrogenimonas sp.]